MAVAKCGMHWSWDSPMWCSGKKRMKVRNRTKLIKCVSVVRGIKEIKKKTIMITEDYVSFETAKLLKENGFDEFTISFYDKNGSIGFSEVDTRVSDGYQRPTLQMTMKWLREVHNVFIDISSRFSKNADKDVCFSYSCKKLINTYRSSYEIIEDGEWLNYEEACEAAVKYCLENLI